MRTALVLHPNGKVVWINLPAKTAEKLAVMRRALGCRLVDVVHLTDRVSMWLDDEGMYAHPVNPIATVLAQRFGFTWQPYYGPVMFTGVDNIGDTVDLTADQVRMLVARLDEIARGRGA